MSLRRFIKSFAHAAKPLALTFAPMLVGMPPGSLQLAQSFLSSQRGGEPSAQDNFTGQPPQDWSSVLQPRSSTPNQFVQGALSGAGIGSVFGPVGAGVGAVAGGLIEEAVDYINEQPDEDTGDEDFSEEDFQ